MLQALEEQCRAIMHCEIGMASNATNDPKVVDEKTFKDLLAPKKLDVLGNVK